MRSLKLMLIAFTILISTNETKAQTTKINTSKSKIVWIGKKITGEHAGSINFKDGYFVLKDKKIAGGSFTVDMKSMSNTDQTGSSKAKLEGHLKSEEFFGVDNNPTAMLTFKSISNKGNNKYFVTADLTIKGITRTNQFELNVKENTATATLKIDRTKYDIKFGSGSYFDDLGDKTIYDEFELDVTIAF